MEIEKKKTKSLRKCQVQRDESFSLKRNIEDRLFPRPHASTAEREKS